MIADFFVGRKINAMNFDFKVSRPRRGTICLYSIAGTWNIIICAVNAIVFLVHINKCHNGQRRLVVRLELITKY